MPPLRRRFVAAIVASSAITVAACSDSDGDADPVTSSTAAPSSVAAPTSAPAATPDSVVVTDQWERSVEVPGSPDRVVVLEWEGLVSKTLEILGESDTIVGADPNSLQPFRKTVVPALADATDVGSPWSGLNFETIASLEPEVVFLEAWANNVENRAMHQDIIDQIEALGIPVVAMMSPSNFEEANLGRAWEIVDLVGAVYQRSDDTDEVIATIEAGIADVTERIPEMTDEERPEAAIFATLNYLMGPDSVQSYLLTEVLGARNLAEGSGAFVPVSSEQLLALDPEALVVIGHEGYLSVDQIRAGENIGLDWSTLAELTALQNDRIVDLGYDEWRPTIETPIAMLKIAAMLYPEEFADVDIAAHELQFYMDVYGLDEEAAVEAIENQKWTPEEG
jgi:iron complex transport system substrate-binding protein